MANNLIKNLFFQLQKRFLQSSATLSSNPSLTSSGTSSSLFTVQYLVNSCGFPVDSALSVSQKFRLDKKNPERAKSVVDLLRSHHFSNAQVVKLIIKQPKFLHCNVEAVLLPKLDYLVKNGFAGKFLPSLILSNPVILTSSLDFKIKPSLEFLKSILFSDVKLRLALKRSSWLLTSDLKAVIQPNIDFLLKERVPAHVLENFLTSHPRALLKNVDRMIYGVNTVKHLGFEPTSPMFMHALRIVLQMSESTWKEKIEIMKSMGWDEDEIFLAFKRCPLVLGISENKMKKALDFYKNTMNFDPHLVISDPKLLMFSIEKRIIPRYNVLKVLESKKLIQGINEKTMWLLSINDEDFSKKYVLKYMVEVPGIVDIYPGAGKFLNKFIEKFKGDVPALLEMYPGAKNFLP